MFIIYNMKKWNGDEEMGISKYQAFLKTVELGSITRAAEELGYTQSAVSRMIADLETEWAVSLLVRGRGGVTLSPAGAELLPDIRTVCNAQRELTERIGALHGLTRGTIRIGTITSISVHWLPGIMKSFLEQYPGIRFELLGGVEYAEIEDWIRKGRVDCGFVGLPAGRELETISLRRDRLVAVLPKRHPLAEAGSCPMERFAQEPFIRPEDDKDKEVAGIFERAGVRPNVEYAVNDDYAVIAMVASGLGISILPELVLRRTPYGVVVKPLDPPQFRELGLAVRSLREVSPVTARFLPHVQAWLKEN